MNYDLDDPAGIKELPQLTHYQPQLYDYLIVGAGFAGSVVAEQLASVGEKRVLVIDRRDHIGGNAYDFRNDAGHLVHRYGPHIFHTNSPRVLTYLSRFTRWRPYEHRVLCSVDGKLVPFPINRTTINRLFDIDLDEDGVREFLDSRREKNRPVRTAEDAVVSAVGHELYTKFFRGYTRKQWGLDPSELDAAVTARIPVRSTSDDRYFTDKYQCMPADGYSMIFERMLSHPRIHVELDCDFRDLASYTKYRSLIYTGCIDEFFDYEYGPLPYRSVHFDFKTLEQEFFQPVGVVNYPNEHLYTRITEFKHLTGDSQRGTTIAFEYPNDYILGADDGDADKWGEPYYPIPAEHTALIHAKYQRLAAELPDVHFVGRLGRYKYYNMDQVVAQALVLANDLLSGKERPRPSRTVPVSQRLVFSKT